MFRRLLNAAGTKTAGATVCLVEFINFNEGNDWHLLNNKLRDTLTALDMNRVVRIEIYSDDFKFTTIMRIDQAGCIRYRKALLERHATARLNKARIAIRKRDSQACRNQHTLIRADVHRFIRT